MSKSLPQIVTSSPREPTEQEQEAIERAKQRIRARPLPLAYEVDLAEGGEVALSALHSDEAGQFTRMVDLFGTASDSFARHTLGSLGAVVREPGKAPPTAEQLNAALAAVGGLAPRNEAEAMLAVQIVATHEAAMSMIGRAKEAKDTAAMERFGTLATKLQRTFLAQLETLAKIRRGGEQKVTVEHVYVAPGGQAIVGAVAMPGGGGSLENGRQPCGPADDRALATSPGAPLLRQDAARDGVPVARHEGPEALPSPRRRNRERRPAG
ncbi:hypothetical protein M446_6903 [Methylobacterium sp. 4-46]|uniref:hypothetical protein n=1 Tax=unclassified Methylobacterium TaxID=2615210 RepID=UPI000152CE12|nr:MULTISPECIES: hypothetical protein [Methylobacterium]ACA21141.1 hypothetical protein M446_6903 [Methylobacterium sp. 4-46]WFT80287.1 hypothetical protein QA634_34845 [Methylobacterium nodulans]